MDDFETILYKGFIIQDRIDGEYDVFDLISPEKAIAQGFDTVAAAKDWIDGAKF